MSELTIATITLGALTIIIGSIGQIIEAACRGSSVKPAYYAARFFPVFLVVAIPFWACFAALIVGALRP